jgi:deazaflavin-dependent oxidoreductase (nitroreductase family)
MSAAPEQTTTVRKSVMMRRKDIGLKVWNVLHRSLYAVTRGKRGGMFLGKPVVELTTVGARSGKQRTVMLTSPAYFDGDPVIVASYAGDDRYPGWYHNLLANPEVEIKRLDSGRRERRRARVLSSEERAGLWPQVKRDVKQYQEYELRTRREIPIVVLESINR